MSNYNGGVGPELYYSFSAAGTALATFTTEASLMGGYPIPQIPATFFSKLGEQSSSMKIRAYGNVGDTTADPTSCTAARPTVPVASTTSTSTVGLPRLSRISRPMMSVMAVMQVPPAMR